MSFLIVFRVIWTGKAADKGHKWAAGNHAYTYIRDRGKNTCVMSTRVRTASG